MWNYFLDNAVDILSAVISLAVWVHLRLQAVRARRPVRVYLQSPSRKVELPLYLTQGELSRAELLGRIGMLPMREPGSRFKLVGLSSPELWKQLRSEVVVIAATEEEIDQFDL